MLPKTTLSFGRLSSDGKSSDLGFGSGLSSDNGYQTNYRDTANLATSHRGTNQWPAPSTGDRVFGGGFGSGISGFGGGFGGGLSGQDRGFERMERGQGFGAGLSGGGFGASPRRNSLWQTSTNGALRDDHMNLVDVPLSTTSETEKDRSLMSPTSESQDNPYSIRDMFASSRNRSPRMSSGRSSSRRSKTGRRKSGRRSDKPGHCFNCGQHGHISKMCPEKAISASADELRIIDSGIGGEKCGGSLHGGSRPAPDQLMRSGDPIRNEQTSKIGLSLNTKQRNSYFEDEKLETQKARLSYYGFQNDDQVTAKSPEVDKFSEQLDNALKLSPPRAETPRLVDTPTRAPEKPSTTGKGGAFPSGARNSPPSMSRCKTPEPTVDKPAELSNEKKAMPLNTMCIETRRTVMRDGEPYFEECTVVRFPSILPPNVRVITAQFVPASTQKM